MIVNVYAYKGAARRERYKHKTARNEAQTKVGAGSAEKGAHIGRYKQLIYKQEVGRKARAASTSQETERKPKHKKKTQRKGIISDGTSTNVQAGTGGRRLYHILDIPRPKCRIYISIQSIHYTYMI